MIRELAENPNLYQPLGQPREIVRDADGRYAVYLDVGTGAHSATVQRVRCDAAGVESLVEDVRAVLRERGREGAEWELGESCTPADLVDRLLVLGLARDAEEPVAVGMALLGRPAWDVPAGVVARRVRSADELAAARQVQRKAFGGDGSSTRESLERARADFPREGVDGSTFVALVDGELAAAAYAAYTPWGLLLFGGATLPEARGRGAYRALVAARADEAGARGTPALVVHAGRMSRPILERLGFEAVARIDRLLDVLPA